MTRHTTFRYCLDPTCEQRSVLVRHAGASRFAFNQCLRMVKDALSAPTSASDKVVPWSGFDLINAFNTGKKTDAAGRTFAVDTDGLIEIRVPGLAWRTEVCQQVFEEAAVDCGRALVGWADSRVGKRSGRRVGFPRFKQTVLIPNLGSGSPKHEPRLKRPDGKALADTSRVLVKPVRVTREQMSRPDYRLEQTTPEQGGAGDSRWVTGAL